MPTDVARNAAFRAFSITPSGDLRALADTHDQQTYVFQWHSDPGNPSQTKLDAPEHLATKSIAAFQSGAMLVSGYFNQAAGERGKSFIAIFDASGKFAARVSGKFGDFDLASIRTKLYEGASAVGDDGYIYLTTPGRGGGRLRVRAGGAAHAF